ncbi:hypothetical protein GCM10010191_12100 [Actinomadura vinacea]|uniref:HTH merR-type domain-containing protein n=1 Tax=Actinomadura vinacea TaxID=115336 RepID=A0ABN3IKE4_9ACTN
MESTWTITELAERAGEALAGDGSVQFDGQFDGQFEGQSKGQFKGRVNGRVRDVPNERLIRWYTTIGLVDPPLGRRGRTALYGTRHLLQVVAVKRRQAAGRSIAEIQIELAGATDGHLREIAQIPSADQDGLSPEPVPERGREDRARPRFWTTPPATPNGPVAPASSGTSASLVQGIRLAPGLTLVLDALAQPALNGEDLAAIETAARPLLDELRRRGLLEQHAAQPDNRPADPSGRSQ